VDDDDNNKKTLKKSIVAVVHHNHSYDDDDDDDDIAYDRKTGDLLFRTACYDFTAKDRRLHCVVFTVTFTFTTTVINKSIDGPTN
jgi:hypothetical protein